MKYFEENSKYPTFLIIDTYNFALLSEEIRTDDADVDEFEFSDLVSYENMTIAVVQKENFNGFILV